jgi:hypothetical protein
MGKTVTTDFKNQIQKAGDTVHANIPGNFTTQRRNDGDTYNRQAATSTDVPIVLNQQIETTFIIYSGQASLSQGELFDTFLDGAIDAVNNGVNSMIMGAIPQFVPSAQYGGLNGFTSSNAISKLVAAKQQAKNFKSNIAPYLAVTDNVEAAMLNNATFNQANTSSDKGLTQMNGYLGQKFGLNMFAPYGLPYTNNLASLPFSGLVNGAKAAGQTVIAYDNYDGTGGTGSSSSSSSSGGSGITEYTPIVGSWVSFADSPLCYKITAADLDEITISPALVHAVTDDSVIEFARSTTVVAETAANFYLSIEVADLTYLEVGNPISIGSANYTIMSIDTVNTKITLDRPLEALAAASAVIGIMPSGNYNLCYRKDAIALINRPLAMMPGANMYTASGTDASLTVTMHFDADVGGTVVTVETLVGVKVLDTNRGFLMLG